MTYLHDMPSEPKSVQSRGSIRKPVFVTFSILIFSSFLISFNTVNGSPFLNALVSEDRVSVVEYTEDDLRVDMRWGSFLTDIEDEGKFYHLYGSLDDIAFQMQMNFDKGTISGSLSGSYVLDQFAWKRKLTFSGEFTGWLDKYNWNYNSWFWEFGSNFSITLTFKMEQRYLNDQNEEAWNSREETIVVTAELTGDSFAGRGGIGGLSVRWEDPGSGVDFSRYIKLSCKNRLSSGGCDLPAELPDVIDIDAEILGPETIRNTDNSATFSLESSGLDLDRVSEVNWYFWYYDEDFGDYWWFETFEKTDTSPIVIDKNKLDDWLWYVSQFGKSVNDEKHLIMQVLVELKSGENEWLLESEGHNFTYVVSQSSGFSLEVVDEIHVYPTMKNSTYFELDVTGTTLTDKITFELSNIPEYLELELKYPELPRASDEILTNELTVTLDMKKAPDLTLPSEQKITLTAKSKKGTENIEASEQITLKLKPVKWLILHYVAEQTYPFSILQSDDEKNIEDILNEFNKSTVPQVGYIIQIDLERPWKPKYYKDTLSRGGHLLRLFNGQLEEIESKTLNMASSNALKNFVDFGHKLIPSEKSNLIITNHGHGISGMVFEGTRGRLIETADSLKPSEFETALSNYHFDVITFETCHSALIENAYQIRDITDYIVASQFKMYGTGLFYENFISQLLSNPDMSSLEHAESIIDTYVHPIKESTISLIKTSELEGLRIKIDDLSKEMRKGYAENREEFHKELRRVIKSTTYTGPEGSIDLFDFCDKVRTSTRLSSAIKEKAQAILDFRNSVILKNKIQNLGNRKVLISRGLMPEGEDPTEGEDFIVRGFVVEESPRTINGLSIWFWGIGTDGLGYAPQKTDFDSTAFAKNTAWKGMIEDYVKGTIEPKVIVTVDQHEKNLFVKIVDSEGFTVGYDARSDTKNKIVTDYQDVGYYRSLEGTTEIILPAGLANFTTIIDGDSMEENEETYTLNLKIVYDDEIIIEESSDYSISIFNEHSIPIKLTDDSISIGELSIHDNTPEPEPEPEEPEPNPGGGGIPGFPYESILLSIIIITIAARTFNENQKFITKNK
jgi:hypothetical protein